MRVRKIIATAGMFALSSYGFWLSGQQNRQPNIIFLMDDQRRWDALGIANPQVITPNLDRLAREGVFFNQAVCQAPMSVASRNSMMLGLYPNQIGTLRNEPGLPDELLPSIPFAEAMARAGYETAGFGKTHWGRITSTRGFEIRYEAECRETGAIMMADVDSGKYKKYNEEIAPFGPGEENVAGYIGITSKLAENEHRDGWLTEKCIEYIRERDDDRPLFLYLSFFKPHAGHNVPAKFEQMYDPDTIRYARQPPWTEDMPLHASGINRRDMYEPYWKNASEEDWKMMTLRYYANCTWLDDMFGRVLDELDRRKFLDNAIIIYVSDHGEMLGEHWYRFNKYCLYESSVRVPIIMSGRALPHHFKGKTDSRAVELTDIYPTLLDAAKIPVPEELPGLSLLGKDTRKANFCEMHERPGEAAFMWRTPKHKLILRFTRKEDASSYTGKDIIGGEFYDLTNDPDEWNDLYEKDKFAKVKKEMTAELLFHLGKLKKMPPHSVHFEHL
jgi:arylsulfatase A-like enzyme